MQVPLLGSSSFLLFFILGHFLCVRSVGTRPYAPFVSPRHLHFPSLFFAARDRGDWWVVDRGGVRGRGISFHQCLEELSPLCLLLLLVRIGLPSNFACTLGESRSLPADDPLLAAVAL